LGVGWYVRQGSLRRLLQGGNGVGTVTPGTTGSTRLDGMVDENAIDVVPSLEAALDRGLELTPLGGELVVLPTYTAMLGLRQIVSARGFVRPYWERAA